MDDRSTFQIGKERVGEGESADLTLKISESYCGTPIHLPLRIIRGSLPGPAVFVTGAIHGDELNGTGIIRELIVNQPPQLQCGTLLLLPVVNMLGFERHSRYMPDRRDLNRSFPGSATGSLAARLADVIFKQVVSQCDFGIDLHTAANFRTTIPNVRVDMTNAPALRLAKAFGCELVVHNLGPLASLRRIATDSGCASILLEAGESWKIQPEVVELGARGIRNVLIALKMIEGDLRRPERQISVARTVWLRAAEAGLLQFQSAPGDWIKPDDAIATNTSLLGKHWSVLRSNVSGVIIGMTTLPAVKPGDPVCHIALLDDATITP